MFVFVMIGPSGAGKSTAAKKIAARHNAEIISTDEIRKMMFGDERDQRHGKRVFEVAYMSIRSHLNRRRNIVFDATNTTNEGRKELFSAIQDYHECRIIAVLVTPPFETALRQNRMRERKVPEKVIRRQYHQLMEDGELIPLQFDQVIFV